MDVKRVLCTTDFSEASERALPAAVDVARRYGATLEVLHVAERLVDVGILGEGAPAGVVDADEARVGRTRGRLEAWVRERVPEGVPVEAAVVEGDAAEEIVRRARDRGADLIVMATHGMSGLERFFLGSVTESVLRHAPCPVLAVPGRSRN